jgi:serine/threonine protein kinase
MIEAKQGIISLLNEIRVNWALEHCLSVLGLLAIHEDPNFIYLVMEYQPYGTLLDVMQK